MEVGEDFPADRQSAEPARKREGRFDDPAVLARAASVPGAAPGDERADAQLTDLAAVDVVVVTAVGVEDIGALTGSSALAADGRYSVDQEPWLTSSARDAVVELLLGAEKMAATDTLGWSQPHIGQTALVVVDAGTEPPPPAG
ncbi:hypothetical protein ACIP39_05365 [Streptomyces tibetensis]|uniref:hypothetical protein n=1 Tax=Streptomyces tibetensis TaxID=2382123 RepID=UPI0038260DAD